MLISKITITVETNSTNVFHGELGVMMTPELKAGLDKMKNADRAKYEQMRRQVAQNGAQLLEFIRDRTMTAAITNTEEVE